MSITHRHHLVPKHRGGTDADGLVEVSIPCHAMFHWCEWQRLGHYEDWLAWRMLAGKITAAEATRLAQINANKTRVWSEESRKKISDSNKKRNINYFARRVFTPEYRKKLSDAAKRRNLKRNNKGQFVKKDK